jgi:centromere/kinetochore protein ZW10
VLPKSQYYVALGSVVDAVLSRVLDDVLALPDIPEVESHRLSELCKILNALEGLFVEDAEQVRATFLLITTCTNQSCLQPSFVVAYVPSWLKFSYLSELLVSLCCQNLQAILSHLSYILQEASIADISYLFQEGALVDFEVDELAKLVRALFADTPLRTATVNKLMGGHPIHQCDS